MKSVSRATTFAASLVVLAFAGSAQATFPGHNGRIAFTAVEYSFESNEASDRVVSIRPDGSAPRLLAGYQAEDPAYRPDGHMIAFTRPGGIFLMRADGSAERRLIQGPYADPDWFPDGKSLVMARVRGPRRIVVWQRGRLRQLTDGSSPAVSPAGRMIAFQRAGRPDAIYLTDFAGTFTRRVTVGYQPEWSPDGRRIIFERLSGRSYTIRPDGSGLRLVRVARESWSPIYSPDGKLISYGKSPPGDLTPDSIFVMRADGRRRTRILDVFHDLPWGPADAAVGLDWQPRPGRGDKGALQPPS